jgi:hypothetical protein
MYRPLQFFKRSQQFVGPHDETLPVAMRVYESQAAQRSSRRRPDF